MDNNKLDKIKELIKDIIKEKYNKTPEFYYEYKPSWLLSFPNRKLIEENPIISEVYSNLVDNKLVLLDRIKELSKRNIQQKQSFDIWVGEPFNFAIEFDEKQHFNQFREITLNYYGAIQTRFPVNYYSNLCGGINIKPGKSGFTMLKSKDPLFPNLLEGERQDNRIRQRAFRDFLKDLMPIEKGYNATVRIPYHITNKKIKDFRYEDIAKVREYLERNNLLEFDNISDKD